MNHSTEDGSSRVRQREAKRWLRLALQLLILALFALILWSGGAEPWQQVLHSAPEDIAGFPITQLSLVISVTPGGLGLFDASWYGVLLLGGVPHREALTFVVAQRTYSFILLLLWAGFSTLLSLAAGK